MKFNSRRHIKEALPGLVAAGFCFLSILGIILAQYAAMSY